MDLQQIAEATAKLDWEVDQILTENKKLCEALKRIIDTAINIRHAEQIAEQALRDINNEYIFTART
tara:strand:- start:36994 stop:37191 length:198 start_codon:yes stop_codon:yes gene_type:complete